MYTSYSWLSCRPLHAIDWCTHFDCMQVAVDCKMAMDIEDYATSFRPDIIDAVSGWCQGATFAKILTLTDVFEVRASVLNNVEYRGTCGH